MMISSVITYAVGLTPQYLYRNFKRTEWQEKVNNLQIPPINRKDFINKPYTKYGRMDDISKMGLSCASIVFDNSKVLDYVEKDRQALIFGSFFGSLDTDIEYYNTVLNSDKPLSSPGLFSYTLPSTVLGEISIFFGITGEGYCINQAELSGIKAIIEGDRMIRAGKADAVLCGGIDVYSEYAAGLIKKTTKNDIKPVSSVFLFLLENKEFAEKRNSKVLAEIMSTSSKYCYNIKNRGSASELAGDSSDEIQNIQIKTLNDVEGDNLFFSGCCGLDLIIEKIYNSGKGLYCYKGVSVYGYSYELEINFNRK